AKYDEGAGCYVVQSFVDDYAIEINYDGKDSITLDTCGCGDDKENFVTWTVSVTCGGTELTDIELVWTSSDETVATVTDGVITAAGNNGTATITVTYIISGNHEISASHDITVSLGGHDLVATYDTSTSSWVYICANDTGDTPRVIPFSKTDTPAASVELVADNETALQKAAYWNQRSDIVPVVHVTADYMATTAISFTGCEKLLLLDGDLTIGSGMAMYVWTTVTIDLNGHTISKSSTETSTASTIEVGATSSYYGNLTVGDNSTEGVGAVSGYYYTITVWGAENADGNKSVLTVESGTITATKGIAISTNGTYPAAEIKIEGGKIAAQDAVYNPAIYLPSGTLYVHDGEISGATGIEVRGGKACITGGTVTSIATTQQDVNESTSNGGVADGYAIALTWNSSYPEDRYVEITGTVVVTGVLWVSETNREYFIIAGGFYSVDPSDFLGDEYIAVESETMEGYFEITGKPEVTVTGLAVADADKIITLDVINGEDQRQITVYILLSDGTYTTYTSGLTWTYEGDATISFDGSGSSVTITATTVGEGKITVSLDGYSVEIAVSVIDSTVVLPSISIAFGDDTTYSSWLPGTIVDGTNYTTGVLTLVTGDGTSGNASNWAVTEGHLNSGGSSQASKGRYFIINLEDYVTKYVSISVKMASNGDAERSLLLSTSSTDTSTSSSNTLRCVTSSDVEDYQTLNVIVEITEDLKTLYLVCGASINFYTIDIEIIEDPGTPVVQSVTLSSETISMYEGDTRTVTAAIDMNLYGAEYDGEYRWELTDSTSESITITTSGFVATIYGGAAGTATVTFTVGEVSVNCGVIVNEKKEGEVTTILWDLADYQTALTGLSTSSLTEYFFHDGGIVDTTQGSDILSYFIKSTISYDGSNRSFSYGEHDFSYGMKSGGAAGTSNGRYFKIDLAGFEAGTEITITVVYCSNDSSSTTTCYIGADLLNTSTAASSANADEGTQSSSTSSQGTVTFTYTVTGSDAEALYVWSGESVRYYGIVMSYIA
ncbi:MAG: hypothetical protein LUD72_09515, partial [Bacteroidales bacterium]|nr:hypothetical protein [Bacteroidales bacterium]